MNNTITWLHLSDFHLTCISKDTDWTKESINQDTVIRSLLDAIDELLIKKDQKPDIIFITGDLTYGGKEEEYQVAEEFCNQLLTITGLKKQNLFIVPGNHDVNRQEVKALHTKSWYQFQTQDDISEILSDIDMSSILLRKLNGFYKFANKFLQSDCKPEQLYVIAKPMEIKGCKINLLGLNSALFSGYDGDDDKKLAFGLHQINAALQNFDKHYLNIAFFHHPFCCFHKCEEPIQNQLKQKSDLILTGHLHDPANMSQQDAAGKFVMIGAGASYEKRNSENSFNVGVLDLETGNGTIQFYKYLEKLNRWTENTDINLDNKDNGRFHFEIPNIRERLLNSAQQNHESSNNEINNLSADVTKSISHVQNTITKKIAILTANPIDKKYDYTELLNGFKKIKCETHYFCFNYNNLNNLDGFDYVFIISNLVKNKLVIEDEYLKSRTVSLKELENNILISDIKGVFVFLDQTIEPEQASDLSLPIVILPALSKNEIQNFIFQAFKKCKPSEDWFIVNKEALILAELKDNAKCLHYKTDLPDAIDPKNIQHYVGRVTDLEVICGKIIDLKDNKNGFLTIKGAGGIGKTLTVKKIAVELATRNFFSEGIDFVDCEFISDYRLFEFNLARTFNLEQSNNVRKYIKDHDVKRDALLILDNFETLLHLSDCVEIKEFLNFICDYVTVVITSRELIELECEQPYELRRFTTDEAVKLFLNEIDRDLNTAEQKLLRNEIIETLLDNNPLAIKLITKNLPKGKSFTALKEELEEDIFQKLTDTELEAFDNYADTNIERKKSLYASINFSYSYLCETEKMTFELLSLFPDGINMENLKRIAEYNKDKLKRDSKEKIYKFNITDAIIHALYKKSIIENSNGVISLQSIVGKFAEQKLRQREDMHLYYENAFHYNLSLLNFLFNIKVGNEHKTLAIFNNHKNNFLKSIAYLDCFECEKYLLLEYLNDMSLLFADICTNENFIKTLYGKIKYFVDNKNENLYFNVILIHSRYFDGDFASAFEDVTKVLPIDNIEKLDSSSNLERAICIRAIGLYGMEGDAYFAVKIADKIKLTSVFYYSNLFYIGEYNLKLMDYVEKEFFCFEIEFNCGRIGMKQLDDYLSLLYKKNHIEIVQCHYLKAKAGIIDKKHISKLVIVNPFTQGLQKLIFAFGETDIDKAIALYKAALNSLKHIKYYYVEALFFYAKFLKTVGLQSQYDDIYQQGLSLAQKHYFRFQLYQFENLSTPKTGPYDSKNYPLPDNSNFDDYINFLIKDLKHRQ